VRFISAALAILCLSCRSSRPVEPIDVVLITIDTLRADHVGAYGDARASTPSLDGLAARGITFEDVVAPAPLTLPSHASILTGTTPLRHGVHDNGFVLSSSISTIAERFAAYGYETAAFVSGFPLSRRFGLARGFSVYNDQFTRGDTHGRSAALERPADGTVASAITWLERDRPDQSPKHSITRSPIFLWVHFFDPHAPYEPPEPFRTRFEQRLYDGEIAFVDAQLGVLLRALRYTRQGRETLIAVCGDHGEGLGDHREPTHGLFLYDSTLRVPLILAGPGIAAGLRPKTSISLIDVAPTLLETAGVGALSGAEGSSLRRFWTRSRVATAGTETGTYAESLFGQLCCGWAPLRGWRDGPWMLIDAPRVELYDLVRDPRQAHNVAADHPVEVLRLRGALDSARTREQLAGAPATTAVLTGDARNRLRTLGYVTGGGSNASMRDPKDMIEVSTRMGEAIDREEVDPANAAAVLAAVVREDPENSTARRHLGIALMRQRRYNDAAKVLQELEAGGDRGHETATLLADIAIARGDLGRARSRLEAVYAQNPDDLAVAFKLALVLARLGASTESIRLFTTIVEREPDNLDAAVDLASALLGDGRAEEAIPQFVKAIASGADTPLAWSGLGFARMRVGDRAAAAEAFRHSLRLDPNQRSVTEALRQATR
jgi:arylsulfatase A-like enzyme/Flp pilus assembly protein TadD